ncbi:hypothetical protein [Streptomyces sp. NPDC101393]|uniref:hypothetical protein n=1 Tax=Streptomyces sp. NPDC101393 TaxID=3366141 RepID=UPI00381D3D30
MSPADPASGLLAPAAVLEFSDDLRYADVEPLRDFLAARLGEIADATEEGTDAQFTATRLRDITSDDCVSLADQLSEWEQVVEAGQVRRPGRTQTLRQNLGRDWRKLTVTASRFRDHADFNPRWRPLRYSCVEHAEFVEQAMHGRSSGSYEDGPHP